jgi:hypothetical protein
MLAYSPGSVQVSAPNPHYYCAACERDLWTKRKRMVSRSTPPTMYTTLDGAILCERCFVSDSAQLRLLPDHNGRDGIDRADLA